MKLKSSPSSAEVKNEWSYTFTSTMCLRGCTREIPPFLLSLVSYNKKLKITRFFCRSQFCFLVLKPRRTEECFTDIAQFQRNSLWFSCVLYLIRISFFFSCSAFCLLSFTLQHTQHKPPCPCGIRTHNSGKREAAYLRLRRLGHWDSNPQSQKASALRPCGHRGLAHETGSCRKCDLMLHLAQACYKIGCLVAFWCRHTKLSTLSAE